MITITWKIKSACTGLALVALLCSAAAIAADAQTTRPLPKPTGKVILEVHGAISNTNADGVAQFDRAMLQALPTVHIDTHTSVTDGVHGFDGFLIRDLLQRVGATGDTVLATALNKYVIEFDIDEFHKYDVIAAYKMDGRQLVPTRKGPLWIVYPRDAHEELQDIRYDYRWVWQLIRLEVK